MRLAVIFLTLLPVFAQPVPIPGDTESSLEQGVEKFRDGRYDEAIAAFQKAVDFDPSDAMAQLYLGIAHMARYMPGMQSAENLAHGQRAKEAFLRAIEIAPANKTALQYLASLSLRDAQVASDPEARIRKLEETREWYRKLLALDANDKESHYMIAVVDWMMCNPDITAARGRLGMKPGEAGPLTDTTVRQSLKTKYSPAIEDGITNLQKALEIDPQYEESMTYMNLLLRARADLRDSTGEYQEDIKSAGEWARKSMEARSVKTRGPGTPQRIRMMQPPALITKIEPVYPPLARQARVQGTVRFTAVIGRDGHIQNLQLISGHPLLVAAAQEAIKQWVFRPTVFNSQSVEVVAPVEVNFVLPAKQGKERGRAPAAAFAGKAN